MARRSPAAPTLSALLRTSFSEGRPGTNAVIARSFRWRVSVAWYAVVLFGAGAVAYLALSLGFALGMSVPGPTLASDIPPYLWPPLVLGIFIVNVFVYPASAAPMLEGRGHAGDRRITSRCQTDRL